MSKLRDEIYEQDLTKLVELVNGFVYPGSSLNAVVDTVRRLRENPLLADRLLAYTPSD